MLPVLLHTETWIYPSAVFLLSAVLVAGQRLMEKGGLAPGDGLRPARA